MSVPNTIGYLRGFCDACVEYGAPPSSVVKLASLISDYRPSWLDGVKSEQVVPGRTYMRAAPPPRHYMRAYDPGAKYRPPASSAEARLNDAAKTAIKATPAALSAATSSVIGGASGVARGVARGDSAGKTILRGAVGAAAPLVPGNIGFANAATGVIESAANGAVSATR